MKRETLHQGRRHRGWLPGPVAALALALILGLACPDVLAASEWAYRVRPGDTLWDLAAEHLKPGVSWKRLQAHNRIADPYRLPPGSVVRIPADWLRTQPAKARVVAVHGVATARLDDGRSEAVVDGMELGIGTHLRTRDGASLTLEFADGSRLRLLANSELALDRMSRYGASGMVDTHLRLQQGRVRNEVRPGAQGTDGFTIDTPHATSSVRGTEFRVEAEAARTRTEVLEGGVHVEAGQRAALVQRGYGVAVDPTAPDRMRPAQLLPAPDPASIEIAGHRVTPHVTWAPVAGAVGYRVQVSGRPGFETLLADQAATAPQTVLPVLEDGEYHASIRAVDAVGLEGFDAVVDFRVDARPEPPFAIAPAADAVVRDERPEFLWSRPQDAAAYRIQIAADDAFTQPLLSVDDLSAPRFKAPQALPPGRYWWRIGSRDATGKYGPFGDPMAFELRPLVDAGKIESETAADAGTMTFRWRAGLPGQRYRFQLARDPGFDRPRIDRMVDQASITIPRLGAGTWYLRAQPIGEDGYEGPMPVPQTVEVPCRVCQWVVGGGALLILLAL